MSNYDRLLGELHAADRRKRTPKFNAGRLADHEREFSKALGQMRRLVGGSPAKQAPPPPPPRPTPAALMATARRMFESGQLSGDQLRQVEARQHQLIDAAARGAR